MGHCWTPRKVNKWWCHCNGGVTACKMVRALVNDRKLTETKSVLVQNGSVQNSFPTVAHSSIYKHQSERFCYSVKADHFKQLPKPSNDFNLAIGNSLTLPKPLHCLCPFASLTSPFMFGSFLSCFQALICDIPDSSFPKLWAQVRSLSGLCLLL